MKSGKILRIFTSITMMWATTSSMAEDALDPAFPSAEPTPITTLDLLVQADEGVCVAADTSEPDYEGDQVVLNNLLTEESQSVTATPTPSYDAQPTIVPATTSPDSSGESYADPSLTATPTAVSTDDARLNDASIIVSP